LAGLRPQVSTKVPDNFFNPALVHGPAWLNTALPFFHHLVIILKGLNCRQWQAACSRQNP
jgi:hypothetical protein